MALQHIEMQLLEFSVLLPAAYIGGKITQKLGIGEIVGQILGGVLVSPYSLEFLYTLFLRFRGLQAKNDATPLRLIHFPGYAHILEGYLFFTFFLLGIIAFSIGEKLHPERLRYIRRDNILISLFQALLTFVLLTFGFWGFFEFPLIQALLIASIGVTSAPALSLVLLKRLNTEGTLRDRLANITAIADLFEILSFAILLAAAAGLQQGNALSLPQLLVQMAPELFWAVMLGLAIFFMLKFSLKKRLTSTGGPEQQHTFLSTIFSNSPASPAGVLVMIMGILMLWIGIGIHFRLPFLISAVLAGMLSANFHSPVIFGSLHLKNLTPLFNLFFFALIGSMIHVKNFSGETLLYITGFLVLRTSGKMLGTWGGCRLTRQDLKITACMPKLVLPQAGMAAVETILAATTLKESGGMQLFHTIIPALVIFELLGAWLSKKTLRKWREWTVGEGEALRFPEQGEHDVSLSDLFQGEIFGISSATKEGAIDELARSCATLGIAPDAESVRERMWEREQLSSTGIGNGIALPHCHTDAIARAQVLRGLTRHPIPWGAPDLQPVQLIFLIINPGQHPEQHLKAIRTISLALQHPDFLRKLKQESARITFESE